ncbi:MAG: hypothetical protein R3A52_30440 [Polyangiales bacterium]
MSDPPADATPVKGGQLLLRGVRVHYREWGEGPTALLLLHDLLMDHRAWRHLAPRLAAKHRVIAPDLPGFGLSEAHALRLHPRRPSPTPCATSRASTRRGRTSWATASAAPSPSPSPPTTPRWSRPSR